MTELALAPRLGMVATPALVGVAQLLELSAADLAESVARELATNPALELAEPAAQHWTQVEPPATEPAGWERLLREVALELPEPDRWIAAGILADLDRHGVLGRTPAEAARWLGVEVERVEAVLTAIRVVGGPALAAVDLRDALLRQAAAEPDPGPPDCLAGLVTYHLDDLAAGHWDRAAAALGVSTVDIRDAVDFLRERVRPALAGLDTGPAGPPPPSPDVVVGFTVDGTAQVTLPEPHPELTVDPRYAALATDGAGLTGEERDRLRAQVAAARDFLARLERRAGTLRRVAEAAVRRQVRFVREGEAAHTPLTRAEVARELGVAESTVSRAVAGKTVQLPGRRCVPFAAFFGNATSALDLIRRLVAAERTPRSDAELARELARHGFAVARRTVAKYRALLAIPPATDR